MTTTAVLSMVAALVFSTAAVSRIALASPNATILQTDVALRESYPTYRASTLFRFRLIPGPVLATIPKDTRVEVESRRIVAKTQEWFLVTYVTRDKTFKGWVYAGEAGRRKYLKLDPGVEEHLTKNAPAWESTRPGTMRADAVFSAFFSTANAQTGDSATEPLPQTRTAPTLLLGLAHVAIFIGSLFSTKKWIFPTSNTYAFLTSLGVLLILGFIPAALFSDLIADILTK